MAPLRWAALRALLPLMVVSRCAVPGPRTLLPILVVLSQSSDIVLMVGVIWCVWWVIEEMVVVQVVVCLLKMFRAVLLLGGEL